MHAPMHIHLHTRFDTHAYTRTHTLTRTHARVYCTYNSCVHFTLLMSPKKLIIDNFVSNCMYI